MASLADVAWNSLDPEKSCAVKQRELELVIVCARRCLIKSFKSFKTIFSMIPKSEILYHASSSWTFKVLIVFLQAGAHAILNRFTCPDSPFL